MADSEAVSGVRNVDGEGRVVDGEGREGDARPTTRMERVEWRMTRVEWLVRVGNSETFASEAGRIVLFVLSAKDL